MPSIGSMPGTLTTRAAWRSICTVAVARYIGVVSMVIITPVSRR
jgi:hypothetical protein